MKNQKGVSLITLIITIIVVIILAVIVLRSGASDTPDQAAFSAFTQEMGELQDAVKTAMLEAKSEEILKGNQRSEAQLYNFIARGGYEGFSGERDWNDDGVVDDRNVDIPNDKKWLTQAHAEKIQCTLINKKYAEETLGTKLPVRKVETAMGVGQEMSYFVTPKGNVLCWPPYVYDGKSYVNANTTVKSDTDIDSTNLKITNPGTKEIPETEATDHEKASSRIIAFENGEWVIVSINYDYASMINPVFKTEFINDENFYLRLPNIEYYNNGENLSEETPEERTYRGTAWGHHFKLYDNSAT